jgi:large subunit ribosomal protein L44
LARLGLPSTPQTQAALLVALTDVSYDPSKLPRSIHAPAEDASSTSTTTTSATAPENNTLLAALGNSLLGLFASEHLSTIYPNLPTRPLKALTSRYVGPAACFAIAKDLGLGVSDGAYVSDGTLRGAVEGQGNAGRSRKRSSPSLGVPVRWVRAERDGAEEVVDASATEEGDSANATGGKTKRRTTWEEVVARSVRSFVGLVYQEKVRRL